MQNNTCYHTGKPIHTTASNSGAFIMPQIPENLVGAMYHPNEGSKLLFRLHIWMQEQKQKRFSAVQCSLVHGRDGA